MTGTASQAADRLAGGYFVLQALLFGAWWLALWLRPGLRAAFGVNAWGDAWLLSFGPADAATGLASLLAGAGLLRGRSWARAAAWACTGAVGYATLYCTAVFARTGEAAWAVVAMLPAAAASCAAAAAASGATTGCYRVARPAATGWNLAKTAAQTTVFWGIFLFLLPPGIVALERALGLPAFHAGWQRGAGATLFALAGCLGIASGIVVAVRGKGTPLPPDTARELVVSGPYAWVRNPMAVAGIAQGVAVGIWLGSPGVIAYALTGGVAWHLLLRPSEERDLEARFGEPYRRYRATVRCWLPRIGPYRPTPAGG